MIYKILSKIFPDRQFAISVDPAKLDSEYPCPVCLGTPKEDVAKKAWMIHSKGGAMHPVHVECLQDQFDRGNNRCPNCNVDILAVKRQFQFENDVKQVVRGLRGRLQLQLQLGNTAMRIARHVAENKVEYFCVALTVAVIVWGQF